MLLYMVSYNRIFPAFPPSFYLAVRKEANTRLVDGTGHKPHYSLRTLCRALKYVVSDPCYNIQRSLYEVMYLSSSSFLPQVLIS